MLVLMISSEQGGNGGSKCRNSLKACIREKTVNVLAPVCLGMLSVSELHPNRSPYLSVYVVASVGG